MTPYKVVYDACLAKILEDEYGDWTPEEIGLDLQQLLNAAVPRFKFPRVSLEMEEEGFSGDLTNSEIQILATYMKCEWLDRSILTWENVKPLYVERDFSPGNLIDKLKNLLESERKEALRLESIYYRSRKGKPFDFSKLAGC